MDARSDLTLRLWRSMEMAIRSPRNCRHAIQTSTRDKNHTAHPPITLHRLRAPDPWTVLFHHLQRHFWKDRDTSQEGPKKRLGLADEWEESSSRLVRMRHLRHVTGTVSRNRSSLRLVRHWRRLIVTHTVRGMFRVPESSDDGNHVQRSSPAY